MVDAGSRGDSFDPRRIATVSAIALAIGIIVAIFAVYLQRGFVPGDAYTYLAAGERLNAGHPLYMISPGDRLVGFEPPFWTVPLLSPPPIAVVWRPLAALPSELGVYVWWLLNLLAIVTAVGLMLRRRPLLVAAALIVLAVPIVYEIGVGNMNGIVLLGLILTWRATALGEERVAGTLTGVLAAFKLTPAVLGWWLLTGRRWTAVKAAIAAGLVILGISLLGAGLQAHLAYLDVIRGTSITGARPLSLGGAAVYLGLPHALADLLPTIALVTGLIAIAVLRNRPGAAWVAAILTLIFGTPTVSINWFIYLLACIGPVVWPMAQAAVGTVEQPSTNAVGHGSQALGA